MFKDYNLNRDYMTKHEDTFKNLSEEQANESEALLARLQTQQGHFIKWCTPKDTGVKTSYALFS